MGNLELKAPERVINRSIAAMALRNMVIYVHNIEVYIEMGSGHSFLSRYPGIFMGKKARMLEQLVFI